MNQGRNDKGNKKYFKLSNNKNTANQVLGTQLKQC